MMQNEVTTFWQFCAARNQAYNNKEDGRDRPWCDDEIINKYRFTNVIRARDKGTVWLLENFKHVSLVDSLVQICAYRWVNWQPTFEEVGLPASANIDDINEWCDRVDARGARGERQVTTRHNAFWKGTRVRLLVLANLQSSDTVAEEFYAIRTGDALVEWLQSTINGLGPFTSVQVAADLMMLGVGQVPYDSPIPLAIGSRFGMYLIETGEFVDPKNKQKLQRKPTDFERHNCKWLVESQPTPAELNCDVPMTYIDIEHALCEFYRYRSLQEGLPTRPAIYQESVGVV